MPGPNPTGVQIFHDLAVEFTRNSRSEDGCLVYTYFQETEEPRASHLLEQWRDQAALDAHIAGLIQTLGPPNNGDLLPAAFMDHLDSLRITFLKPLD